ncbi:MAG: F0F1 ATP synthase subunit B' [Paracoccaceae bacterium]
MDFFISAAHAATGGEESGATGLPQLDFATYPSQVFWLIVTLVALYLIFARNALPRIGEMIEERHDTIEDDLDRAADYKRRAEDAEAAYERAKAEARAEAQRIAEKTRREIEAETEKAIAKADAEIAARAEESEKRIGEIRAEAREAVGEVARETAQALVEAVAPDAADADAVVSAVRRRMEG